MVEWMIFFFFSIATTLGAAGRATGILSTLPRTVVDILGTVVGILEAVTDILGVFVDIL